MSDWIVDPGMRARLAPLSRSQHCILNFRLATDAFLTLFRYLVFAPSELPLPQASELVTRLEN